MGIFGEKKQSYGPGGYAGSGPAAQKEDKAGKTVSRGEQRMEKILKLPVPLSYPFYLASVITLFVSVFLFMNGLIVLAMRHFHKGTIGKLSIVPVEFGGIDSAGKARLLYYIPVKTMPHLLVFALILGITGLVMMIIRKYVRAQYELRALKRR
jgi:hypothetical protein